MSEPKRAKVDLEGEKSDDFPDAATCNNLCAQFAEITGTDDACGHFFLQDVGWNLQRAVDAFFSEAGPAAAASNSESQQISSNSHLPSSFSVLCWNIDGLDTANLKTRINAVYTVILQCAPDVIFLQEVVQEGHDLLKSKFSDNYHLVNSGGDGQYLAGNYFTMILLRKEVFSCDGTTVEPFPSTQMQRSLLRVKTKLGSLPIELMTTHLESMKEHSDERMNQLRRCFRQISQVPNDTLVICGGDLNLRDPELVECGGLPMGIVDTWVKCGSKTDQRFTWDCLKNDNKHFDKFKPRCRFDRLFYTCGREFEASSFQLVGTQRIKTVQCFPSDHFGMLVEFTKIK